MNLIWVDWVIVAIIVISSVISLSRGFIKELLSLAIWLAAIVVAWLFGGSLAVVFERFIETPSIRVIVACTVLFVSTLIVGSLISLFFSQLVKATGLTGTDRVLGMVFGAARGVLIVVILVGIVGFAPVKNDHWWKQSVLLPQFEMLADWSKRTVMDLLAPLLQHK